MIKRHLEPKLIELARTFPVVTVTGPRQSGKTTLVKWAFPEYDYVSLEDPDEREFATEDPRGFLRRFSKGVVFDEVQKTPHLLSYIQGIVDSNPKAGQFILTGSNQFRLLNKISQSLAGRTAILYLLPFSFREILGYPPEDPCTLKTKKINPQGWSLEEVLFKGFYPPIHDRSLPPHAWLSGYHQTYIERDVREVLNIGNLDTFHRFIRLCATRAGQLLNLSSLAVDAGISHTTARTWLSVLQASFILYTLQPHFANFSKRIIKTPKLYFYDTGLLCYLLRIRTPEELMTHPMKGHIFENFIITEFYKAFVNRGETPPLYFWRDRTGHEIDLIIDRGRDLLPIEIKSTETVVESLLSNLKFFISLGKPASDKGILYYAGEKLYQRGPFSIRPWYHVP